jgi:3-oxosteroid 1-dehydrogenase
MSAGTTRRQIITSAGTLAAGLAAGVLAPKTAAETRATERWDQQAEIVCVGGGAAALTAAAVATAANRSVIVLEKGPVIGGTTAKSGAVYWIPNHFALREAGIDDRKADAMRYMCRYSWPEAFDSASETLGLAPEAYRLIEAFYDNGAAMIDHLRAIGALDSMAFRDRFDGAGPLDYQSHSPENRTPRGRPLCPRRKDGKQGGGADLIGQLAAFLETRKVPVLTEHAATRLIVEDGAVVGVEARTGDKVVNVRARQAVIFGTGGYANNPALLRRHQQVFHYGSCASALATGDFIALAESVGGALGGMSNGWRTPVVLEEALKNRAVATGSFVQPGDSMFVVNRYGRRVANEKRNYNDRTRVHLTYDPNTGDFPNLLTFYVYDRRVAEAYAGDYPLPRPGASASYVISGATLDELTVAIRERLQAIAHQIGGLTLADGFAAELARTFERFNGFARAGKDEDFGRGDFDYDRQWSPWFGPMRTDTAWAANDLPNPTLYPLQQDGPYHCIMLAPGLLDTNGGPVINERAQVMHVSGAPIPGLYGAGNCVASPSRNAYYGAGGTIGLAMTYGYIAAREAMKEPARDA